MNRILAVLAIAAYTLSAGGCFRERRACDPGWVWENGGCRDHRHDHDDHHVDDHHDDHHDGDHHDDDHHDDHH